METLIRLTYASRIAADLTRNDLKQILASARRKNKRNGICGLLSFTSKSFFQILEGPRSSVNETMMRICQDERHFDITLLRVSDIPRATFSEWSMMWLGIDFTIDSRPVVRFEDFAPIDGEKIESELIRCGLASLGKLKDPEYQEVRI